MKPRAPSYGRLGRKGSRLGRNASRGARGEREAAFVGDLDAAPLLEAHVHVLPAVVHPVPAPLLLLLLLVARVARHVFARVVPLAHILI